MTEIKFAGIFQVQGANAAAPIIARCDGEKNSFVDRSRENVAFVVVGVFSDKIDSARRTNHERIFVKQPAKLIPHE